MPSCLTFSVTLPLTGDPWRPSARLSDECQFVPTKHETGEASDTTIDAPTRIAVANSREVTNPYGSSDWSKILGWKPRPSWVLGS